MRHRRCVAIGQGGPKSKYWACNSSTQVLKISSLGPAKRRGHCDSRAASTAWNLTRTTRTPTLLPTWSCNACTVTVRPFFSHCVALRVRIEFQKEKGISNIFVDFFFFSRGVSSVFRLRPLRATCLPVVCHSYLSVCPHTIPACQLICLNWLSVCLSVRFICPVCISVSVPCLYLVCPSVVVYLQTPHLRLRRTDERTVVRKPKKRCKERMERRPLRPCVWFSLVPFSDQDGKMSL